MGLLLPADKSKEENWGEAVLAEEDNDVFVDNATCMRTVAVSPVASVYVKLSSPENPGDGRYEIN